MDKIGFRSFLFESDGKLRRLSLQLTCKLNDDARTTLPEYAGQSLRHALVVLELDERGRPHRIDRVEGGVFHFDERGSVQRSRAAGAMQLLQTAYALEDQEHRGARLGHVVDLRPHVERKKCVEKHRWHPGPEEIQRIVGAIWKPRKKPPSTGPGSSRTRKRPSLTVVS